jgi:hypothetical protein
VVECWKMTEVSKADMSECCWHSVGMLCSFGHVVMGY